jgi:hypothetical protein
VDGDFLVYVSAGGRRLWRGDEDRPAESLEAFAAPIRSYVSAVGMEETDVRGGDWAGDYGLGELKRPIAPWHPLWVLTKDGNSAAGPSRIVLPRANDRYADSQCDKADAVVNAIRQRLVGGF